MFAFVIVIAVSIIGLAIIGTNNNMHNDPKLIAAWGWGMLTIIALGRFM